MFTGGVPQHDSAGTFEELGLSGWILEALRRVRFEHPTPIQTEVIPIALAGKDVIGLAQTGSGKTAAFGLPLIERLHEGSGIRGLILCPTREIALQTESFLKAVLGESGQRVTCLIGGVKLGPQISALHKDPDVVVATPGRLYDHLNRKNLRLNKVKTLVLDEGDHMLDLGFLPQIMQIVQAIPANRQTMLFSATMPPPIERLARRFLTDPELVDLRPQGGTAEGIEHRLYLIEPEDMRACLMALVKEETGSMLVFIRRRVDAEWACKQIEKEGHPVERIHSDRSQGQRVAALQGLREGEHRVLVATDIAARGIDLPIVAHIVNFGLPDAAEDYIHRAGRTARGSAKGTVSTIASWQDKESVRLIEKAVGRPLPRFVAEGIKPYVERKQTIRGRQKLRRRML